MRGSDLDIELRKLLPRLKLLLKGFLVFWQEEGGRLDVDVHFINRLFPTEFVFEILSAYHS